MAQCANRECPSHAWDIDSLCEDCQQRERVLIERINDGRLRRIALREVRMSTYPMRSDGAECWGCGATMNGDAILLFVGWRREDRRVHTLHPECTWLWEKHAIVGQRIDLVALYAEAAASGREGICEGCWEEQRQRSPSRVRAVVRFLCWCDVCSRHHDYYGHHREPDVDAPYDEDED